MGYSVYKPIGSKVYKVQCRFDGYPTWARKLKTGNKRVAEKEASVIYESYLEWINSYDGVGVDNKVDLRISAAIEKIEAEHYGNKRSGQRTVAILKRMEGYLQQFTGKNEPLLTDVEQKHIPMIKNKLATSGRSEGTQARYLAHLKTLLRMAKYEWGYSIKLPRIKVQQSTKKSFRKIYSKEEEKLIIQVLRHTPQPEWIKDPFWPNLADLFEVLIDTGMRVGEALQCEFSTAYGYDMDNRRIILDPQFIHVKTNSARVIPMTTRVYNILKRRRDKLGFSNKPFPYDNSNCSNGMKKLRQYLIEELEMEGIHGGWCLYGCRHTCATRLLQNGADIETVRVWLGHESVQTTQIYLRTNERQLKQAAELLEENNKHLYVVASG
jgi:integrase